MTAKASASRHSSVGLAPNGSFVDALAPQWPSRSAAEPIKCVRLGRNKSLPPGEVVEWLMALVLKTSDVKASVGSNPTLSVS